MTTPTPEAQPAPIYPLDLDLTAITQRDDAALPVLQALVDAVNAQGGEAEPDVILLMRAITDRHALLTELQTCKRDRDSARSTVLSIGRLVSSWTPASERAEELSSEFRRGLAAAARTMAEVLARQLSRD